MKKILNRDQIKYIAIVAMLLDHIAWYFLEFSSPLAQAFHVVGRITAPTMCFFLAQGYRYTSNKGKYALRLFAFAVIAQVPWWAIRGGGSLTLDFNMLFTLLICLGVLVCFNEIENKPLKILSIAALVFLSRYCDWSFMACMFTLVFYLTQDDEKKMCLWFSLSAVVCFAYTLHRKLGFAALPNALLNSLFMLGLFLCIPLLLMYNGERGRFKGFNKWFFYGFYPAHLGVIAIILRLR